MSSVDKLSFLDRYALDGKHYDRKKELSNIILHGSPSVKGREDHYAQRNDFFFVKDNADIDEHIDDMRKSTNGLIRGHALSHPSTEEHHLVDLLSHPRVKDVYSFMVKHPKATQPVLDHIAKMGDVFDVQHAILHPNNKNALHHIDILHNERNFSSVKALIGSPDVSPEMIRHIHSKNEPAYTLNIARSPHTPSDVHESLFKEDKSGYEITPFLLQHAKSHDLINKIMSSASKLNLESGALHGVLVHNKHAPTNHLIDAVNHPKLSNAIKRFATSELMHRGHYDKDLGISESLNTVEPKETIPEDSMVHQMGLMSAAMIGGTNFSIHKIGDLGHLVQFDKDGATEVHHLDPMLSGGHMVGSATPSMRMISTFKNHIHGLLDDGKTVRISTHKNMAKGFRSITQRLIDKNPEYKMSEPTDTKHELTGDELTQWELKK